MAGYTDVITKSKAVHLQSLRDDLAARRDPNFFWPTGTQVYCGQQGSGKTISAVKHMLDIKHRYPQCIVVSNLALSYLNQRTFSDKQQLAALLADFDPLKDYLYFKTMDELEIALTQVNNGFMGVMYLIDEIHTYFNALDSKNIPMYVFTEISQQRKQRKVIIGTSQLFLRMAKPFREQCDNLIICKTFMGFLTFQQAYDGMSLSQEYDGSLVGKKKKSGWFFHTRRIRGAFDTYQKVISGAEQYEQIQRLELNTKKRKLQIV